MKVRPRDLDFDASALDALTTRQDLARLLDACPRSVTSYHALALDCLPDYLEAFPKAGRGAITRYPLIPYQCWAIHRIRLALKLLTAEELRYLLVEDFAFAEGFGRPAFDSLYPSTPTPPDPTRHDDPQRLQPIAQSHAAQTATPLRSGA